MSKKTRAAPSRSSALDEATPELRRLVERLVAEAVISPAASLAQIRRTVAGAGILTGNGELIHPQDRTSFVIELDELIERQTAPKTKSASGRARTRPARSAPRDEAGSSDEALSSALYGAGDEPERSSAQATSIEDPLQDWPESAAEADYWQADLSDRDRSRRES